MDIKIPILTFCQIFKGVKFKFKDDFHIEYSIILSWNLMPKETALSLSVKEKHWNNRKTVITTRYADLDCCFYLGTIKFL